MPWVFRDLLGMTGYIYDESGSPHHEPHIHVYTADIAVEFLFDGHVLRGDVSQLTSKQRKELKKWLLANKPLLEEKWKELNEG